MSDLIEASARFRRAQERLNTAEFEYPDGSIRREKRCGRVDERPPWRPRREFTTLTACTLLFVLGLIVGHLWR